MGAAMQTGFVIHAATGLLAGVRQLLSPHCDARPLGARPELIVVHGISLPPGEFGGPWIERLFAGNLDPLAHPQFAPLEGLRVSAHVLVGRDGRALQCVPFGLRAWHAGASSWRGRAACNDFSVGIELEGTDLDPYEAAQYRTLAATYPGLAAPEVVGHSDIAPGRKSDPGAAFDWSALRSLLSRSA